MNERLALLLELIRVHHGINDKAKLAKLAMDQMQLVKDRSVYYCADFAIRFSSSGNQSFRNTVISLSHLQKFDDRLFIVCLVTPTRNFTFIANSTFLKKISHDSHQLRENNIRGSFNGSNIMRFFDETPNIHENFEKLFNIHAGIGFEGNLPRLVEATNGISPTGVKFLPDEAQQRMILLAPKRAIGFTNSTDSLALKAELDNKVEQFKNEILLAALIENVNVRGRIIEYLIAGEDERLREEIIAELIRPSKGIPPFKTDNSLGDYSRNFHVYRTETDVKTKIMILNSNPKAYNLDKMLEFLASENSVFMFYFVGIEPGKIVNTVLVSMFQNRLLDATILLKHWAGRNSRGVSQFEGNAISKLISSPEIAIDLERSITFLQKVLAL